MAQTPERVNTDKAPAALGPYSQAIRVGDFVFTSGQLGLDPASGNLAGSDIASQVEQALKNVSAVLESAGTSLANVVKTTCFLAHMSDFAEMNAIYARYFGDARPARSTVEVSKLPKDGLFEIETVALITS